MVYSIEEHSRAAASCRFTFFLSFFFAQAYEKNGLKLVMTLSKPDPSEPSKTEVLCTFTNSTSFDFSQFVFQAAVPKFVELKMEPPSGNSITKNGGTLTQILSAKNTQLGTKTLMVCCRQLSSLSFTLSLVFPRYF